MGLTHLWTWEALSEYGGKSTQDEVRAFVPWQLRDTGSQIGLGKKKRHYSSSSLIWSLQTDIISDINTPSSMVSSEVVAGANHTDAFSEVSLMFHDPILMTVFSQQSLSAKIHTQITYLCYEWEGFWGDSNWNLSPYPFSLQKIKFNVWTATE